MSILSFMEELLTAGLTLEQAFKAAKVHEKYLSQSQAVPSPAPSQDAPAAKTDDRRREQNRKAKERERERNALYKSAFLIADSAENAADSAADSADDIAEIPVDNSKKINKNNRIGRSLKDADIVADSAENVADSAIAPQTPEITKKEDPHTPKEKKYLYISSSSNSSSLPEALPSLAAANENLSNPGAPPPPMPAPRALAEAAIASWNAYAETQALDKIQFATQYRIRNFNNRLKTLQHITQCEDPEKAFAKLLDACHQSFFIKGKSRFKLSFDQLMEEKFMVKMIEGGYKLSPCGSKDYYPSSTQKPKSGTRFYTGFQSINKSININIPNKPLAKPILTWPLNAKPPQEYPKGSDPPRERPKLDWSILQNMLAKPPEEQENPNKPRGYYGKRYEIGQKYEIQPRKQSRALEAA